MRFILWKEFGSNNTWLLRLRRSMRCMNPGNRAVDYLNLRHVNHALVQAIQVVRDRSRDDDEAVEAFIDRIFTAGETISRDMTPALVIHVLANWAANAASLTTKEFEE